MWSTLDIAPNVPRWYEDQVKNSHCVVVLASDKMSLRCQNTAEEGDDRKYSQIHSSLVGQTSYSELSLRRTPSGPALAVRLRESFVTEK